MLSVSDQFRRGVELVAAETGISQRKACIQSGIHERTLRRFMLGKTDIRLTTLDSICRLGFGTTFMRVFHMGGE